MDNEDALGNYVGDFSESESMISDKDALSDDEAEVALEVKEVPAQEEGPKRAFIPLQTGRDDDGEPMPKQFGERKGPMASIWSRVQGAIVRAQPVSSSNNDDAENGERGQITFGGLLGAGKERGKGCELASQEPTHNRMSRKSNWMIREGSGQQASKKVDRQRSKSPWEIARDEFYAKYYPDNEE